jgi:hypothetical protein
MQTRLTLSCMNDTLCCGSTMNQPFMQTIGKRSDSAIRMKMQPYAKGEGALQMVSDFVSADYGWLHSPCGLEEARQLFKAGKNQNGYFTNDNIVEQAERAMDILEKYFPHDDHVLVYDNASTHLIAIFKRVDYCGNSQKNVHQNDLIYLS